MISYRDYQLPQSTIDYLKEKNARQSIAKYIEEHGEEPSDISQFFIVSPDEIEQYKRVSYAKLLTSGKVPENQEEEQGELVTRSFGISAVDDNILGANGEILRAGNDNYQYNYWRIIVESKSRSNPTGTQYEFYAIGDFTSLANVSIILDTRYYYTFFIYLKKTNFIYNYTASTPISTYTGNGYNNIFGNIADNRFKYCLPDDEWGMPKFSDDFFENDNCLNYSYLQGHSGNTGLLWSYEFNKTFNAADSSLLPGTWIDNDVPSQKDNKEYIGIIIDYDPVSNETISGTVCTLNPHIKCTFTNFTKDSGTINVTLGNISFWYNNDIIETSGNGQIINQTETSFDYIFSKEEFVNEYSLYDMYYTYSGNYHSCDLSKANAPLSAYSQYQNRVWKTFNVTASKEGYMSNTSDNIMYVIYRNDIFTTSVTVPNLGTTTEPGIDIGIIDD